MPNMNMTMPCQGLPKGRGSERPGDGEVSGTGVTQGARPRSRQASCEVEGERRARNRFGGREPSPVLLRTLPTLPQR